MVALSRNVARKHAMEMLLTGDMVAAADAHRIGLVNRVGPAGEARRTRARAGAPDRVEIDADRARSASRPSTGRPRFGLADAYQATPSTVMVENMLARDAEEGIGAFIEKRDPTWEDR